MPFLSRRSVEPLTSISTSRDNSSSSLPHSPRSRARSEASIFRRVSTLFSVRRRTPSKPSFLHKTGDAGIGYIHAYPWTILPRVSSDSTPHSSLEIRRPSGLGRRASVMLESNDSSISISSSTQSDGEKCISEVPRVSASLPNLLSGASHLRSLEAEAPARCTRTASNATLLPDSILQLVFGRLATHDLAVVARVSRSFCKTARHALYRALDIHNTSEVAQERLYNVLASREDLAALVVSFYCQAWPSSNGFSSIPSPNIRLAFRNMYNLKSLTLPCFVTVLSHTPSFTFSLTQLTVLDKWMTQSQLVALRSWLATQPFLESLSFPNLAGYTHADSVCVDKWSPALDPNNCSSYSTILPRLRSLHASAEIIASLSFTTGNPIQCLTLNVHGTLYTGLRPNAVVRSLSGVRDMHVIFAPEVDKRTVEKFLAVTGSTLTGENTIKSLKSLEVQVSWTDEDAAETLYGIVTSIISRFRGLEMLKLTSPFRSIQAPIPLPVSMPSCCPPSIARALPQPADPSTFSSTETVTSTHTAAVHVGAIRKEFVACTVEQSYARTWTKNCPSLADIQFDFTCSTTDAEVELCGVWFRRKMSALPHSTA